MGDLRFTCSVTVVYIAVVFKKGNAIRCGFYPQDNAEFVVQFYRSRTHDMFDTCAFNAGIESVAHIVLIITMKFLLQKCCDILRFYGMYGCFCNWDAKKL